MKKVNVWMKLLLALPVVLLLCLLLWIGKDQLSSGGRSGSRESSGEEAFVTLSESGEDDEGTFDGGSAGGDGGSEEGLGGDASLGPLPSTLGAEDASTSERTEEDQGVTLLFAGDVNLSSHVLNAYDKAGGIQGVLDEEIRTVIDEADLFIVNQEFPFSDRGTAADKQYTYRLPPSRVPIMNEMGIDVVTLANNHALDYGRDALVDTCALLDQAGIGHVGAGGNLEEAKKLVTMEAGGRIIGFLGASRVIPEYGWNAGETTPGMLTTYDPAILLEEIKKAKEVCDYLVVYVHWGKEKAETPQDEQRDLGKDYIDAGADLVVGSHPHVLQGIEYYNGKPIVYSLGNFVFGSRIPRTALLRVELREEGAALSILPCTSKAGFTSMAADKEAGNTWEYLTQISFGVTVDEAGNVIP